jgi:hypothetical protein
MGYIGWCISGSDLFKFVCMYSAQTLSDAACYNTELGACAQIMYNMVYMFMLNSRRHKQQKRSSKSIMGEL